MQGRGNRFPRPSNGSCVALRSRGSPRSLLGLLEWLSARVALCSSGSLPEWFSARVVLCSSGSLLEWFSARVALRSTCPAFGWPYLRFACGWSRMRNRHRASIPSQNMPNTTAVRKAKDMMAASTLSLVCSSITASFVGSLRPVDASCPAPTRKSIEGFHR